MTITLLKIHHGSSHGTDEPRTGHLKILQVPVQDIFQDPFFGAACAQPLFGPGTGCWKGSKIEKLLKVHGVQDPRQFCPSTFTM